MSYVTQRQPNQPLAILGAIGIPAAFAGLLVVGLAVKAVVDDKPDNPIGILVTPKPPPPPEPAVESDTTPKPDTTLPKIYVPDSPIPTPKEPTGIGTTGELTPLGGDIDLGGIDTGNIGIGDGLGDGLGDDIAPKATFDPISAKPANDPSRWVTDRDYRSIWVRREYSGTASFLLQVSTAGRVTNCSITQTTGHAALDAATCKLIAKRARFDPAKDGNGAPTAGTFRSSINWQLPE